MKGTALSRYARVAAGLVIATFSFYLALRNVSFGELRQSISGAHLLLVLLALVSVGFNNLGKAMRWKVLMNQTGEVLSLKRSLAIILASQALNTIYPARAGDASRVYAGGERGPGWSFTLGTVVLEKFFDIFSYLLLFGVLFILMPLPAWVNQSVISFVVVALAGLSLVWLVVYRLEWITGWLDRSIDWLPERFQPRLKGWLHSGLASAEIFRDRRALMKLAIWSALVWGTAVLTNDLTLRALGIELPLAAPILILMVLQAGLSLPSVPGGVGLIEYLCILALAVFGVPQGQALAYGILLHLIILLPQTLIGLVCIGVLGMHRRGMNSPDQLLTKKFDPLETEAAILGRGAELTLPGNSELR